jgi:hypothetical protein
MKMRGRPTMIRNLVAGVPCRILVYVHYYQSARGYIATSPDGMIRLVGRTEGLSLTVPDTRVSIYGHRSLRGKFVVEEVES